MNCIKNTVLHKEGDICKFLYFVKSGEFQVTKKVYLPKLEEEDEDGNTNELNHFMLQCARIPIYDKPSSRKIMQIALNIGQLQSEVELIGIQNLSSDFERFYRTFCELGMREFEAYIVS